MINEHEPHLLTLAELNRLIDELVTLDNERPPGVPRPLELHRRFEELNQQRNVIYQLVQGYSQVTW